MSSRASTTTFGAVGDIALAGPTAAEMQRRGPGWLLHDVLPVLRRADVLFGNLECAIVPPGFPAAEIDARGLVGTFDGTGDLADAGFDVLSLANNHILDGGTTGLEHTASVVESRGMIAGGIGATQEEARRLRVVESAGLRLGFLCYAEDSNYSLSTSGPCYAYYEPASVLADIAAVRGDVDVLVVSVHADLEFAETPSVPRRDAFRRFAEAGATLVLGHHPHVSQGIERVGSGLVAYSLGNFVFHAHSSSYLRAHWPKTARSFVLLAQVGREGVQRVERIPVSIGAPPLERPAVMVDAADAFAAHLAELDRMVADDALVARNWRRAAEQKLVSSLGRLAALDDVPAVLHTLGTLTYVAENRAWVDEIHAAVAELWERQRRHVDPYHRPSFATDRATSTRRSLLGRAGTRLRDWRRGRGSR